MEDMEDINKENYNFDDISPEEINLFKEITNNQKIKWLKNKNDRYLRKYKKSNWKRNEPVMCSLVEKGYIIEHVSKKGGNVRIYSTEKGRRLKETLESFKDL